MTETLEFYVNHVLVRVFPDSRMLGETAALETAVIIRDAIERTGSARLVVGTGNSQNEVIAALAAQPRIDWNAVELFHLDEYVGLPASQPGSLRGWLASHFLSHVKPGKFHGLDGMAADLDAECRRYAELIAAAPIDVTLFGIGENGHIAFNEPGVADFEDPVLVKVIALNEASRRQQVGEGHFPSVAEVPSRALTITCPVIAGARHLIGCVPDLRKAEAVHRAINGGLTPACPASMVFAHPHALLYLDKDSASLLGRNA